jgi:vacuolar-type H+-ATPase subunit F/Vma7
MNKLIVITTMSMANGYRLAGIEARGVEEAEEAAALLKGFIERNEPVLLAIDDDLFSRLDRKLLKALYDCNHLALVTIPGKSEKMSTRVNQDHLFNMIRHATGVQIHFKGEGDESSK